METMLLTADFVVVVQHKCNPIFPAAPRLHPEPICGWQQECGWNVISHPTPSIIRSFFYQGVDHFNAGNFAAAERHFCEARNVLPDDGPSKLLIELCHMHSEEEQKSEEALCTISPARTWDGVIRFDKK